MQINTILLLYSLCNYKIFTTARGLNDCVCASVVDIGDLRFQTNNICPALLSYVNNIGK
jgi:hypothetical protein